jgi:hypothetical protein
MLIDISRKDIFLYRGENGSCLKETIVYALYMSNEKFPDFFLISEKNCPDKLLIFHNKLLISKFWIWQAW